MIVLPAKRWFYYSEGFWPGKKSAVISKHSGYNWFENKLL
jgi:hypothetical protein